jgi:hypothetical protein
MNVQELIEQLQKLPQEKTVICQVVGQDYGTWSMWFEFNDVNRLVQLRIFHPLLMDLPTQGLFEEDDLKGIAVNERPTNPGPTDLS